MMVHVQRKGLAIRNTHVKYQSSKFHCSKVISKVNVSDRQDKNNMPPDLQSHGHKKLGMTFLCTCTYFISPCKVLHTCICHHYYKQKISKNPCTKIGYNWLFLEKIFKSSNSISTASIIRGVLPLE